MGEDQHREKLDTNPLFELFALVGSSCYSFIVVNIDCKREWAIFMAHSFCRKTYQ